MAEEQQDDSQKTEEPTQKRLDEAREKGQIAKSQETNHWFIILAFATTIGLLSPLMARGLGKTLLPFIESPHLIPMDGDHLKQVFGQLMTGLGWALALPATVVVFAALAAGFLQSGFIFSVEPITPKLEKISLLKGIKRLFSSRSLAEVIKGFLKLAIVAAAIGLLLWPEREAFVQMVSLDATAFLYALKDLAFRVLVVVLAVMSVIAGLDYLYQKSQHHKQLRMSKQELKDEFKQTEGDPMVKSRLRQIRMERARQRMMAAVPEADVVVTNPTHFAVALKYDQETMPAPRLIAKGADQIAFKLRELAKEHEVPIVENPPLARSLFDSVELDQEIRPEHYKAVAEVISYVMRINGKLRSQRQHQDN